MADKPLRVVILAAGKSTRMKSDTPKVLHKLAGIPVLRWVIDQADAIGAEEILVVVGHEGERVREAFKYHAKVRFVTQEPQLGTGHAVMQARDALESFDGDVAVLCGDVPLIRPRTMEMLRHMHATEQSACTILTTLREDPTGYGRIVRDGMGRVRRIVEQKDLAPGQDEIKEVNTGTYLFDCRKLLPQLDKLSTDNAQGEYYLTDVVPLLADAGEPVRACACDDTMEVMGINNRKQLAVADKEARRRIMEELMIEKGVTIYDPDSTYIEAHTEIGRDTVIFPHSVVRAGVEIGEHCEIGPFAHLREGTKLGPGCKVGAFVETKKATFGAGSKSGHLAYLGDVTMGRDVNIGAGSIIANYDGVKKHQTEIGDGAFIGCGTVLVAPVKVGRGAQTGANTVVPHGKDVPDNTVVIGIPARELRRKREPNAPATVHHRGTESTEKSQSMHPWDNIDWQSDNDMFRLFGAICTVLQAHRTRATYGAVAELVLNNAQAAETLGQRLDILCARAPLYSWIVNAATGRPTGYEPGQIDQNLNLQTPLIDDNLRQWLNENA